MELPPAGFWYCPHCTARSPVASEVCDACWYPQRVPLVAWATLTHERLLGSGAFGTVVLMNWHGAGGDGRRQVAVKCSGHLPRDACAIHNERRLHAVLHLHPHPNVIPVYGLCEAPPHGSMGLLMKYCRRGSVESILRHPAVSAVVL